MLLGHGGHRAPALPARTFKIMWGMRVVRGLAVAAAITTIATIAPASVGADVGISGGPTVRLVVVGDVAALTRLASHEDVIASHPELGITVLEVPATSAGTDAQELASRDGVAYVERDVEVHTALTPNDPLWGSQWGPRVMRMPEVWDRFTGASSVTIAVLDTGLAPHSELNGRVVTGWSAFGGSTADANGHGTSSTLVAAAEGNNASAIAGYCWQCRVMPIKVLDDYGSGSMSAVSAGIRWATDAGADVISMSLSGPFSTFTLDSAVRYAHDRGVILVAAAGNEGKAVTQYPAGLPDVISVAGHDASGARYEWSNYGLSVDVAAPGCHIVTRSFAPVTFCGTSSATPAVAGAAGILLSAGQTPAAVEAALLDSAVPNYYVAAGRVDVEAAATLLAQSAPPTTPPPTTPPPTTTPPTTTSPPLPSDPQPVPAPRPPQVASGYRLVAADGGIFSFGAARFYGSTSGRLLGGAIVGAVEHDAGYWLAGSDGTVHAFGSAPRLMRGALTPSPITAIVRSNQGDGLWLVDTVGTIRSDGDAMVFSPASPGPLNNPIVGAAALPFGAGLWRVASDGGIFSAGAARFHGSTGATPLNQPIVGMAATPTGQGYWLVARDGGIFAFGDASFYGSTGATPLNQPIVGMVATSTEQS